MNLGVGLEETKNQQLKEVMEVKRKVTRAGIIIGEMSRRKTGISLNMNPIFELDESVENEVQEEPEA